MRLLAICLLALAVMTTGCASNSFNTRIQRASSLILAHNYTEAEIQLKTIITQYPEKPEPFYLYGLINFARGNYPECITNFNQAERNGLITKNDLILEKGIALYHTGNRKEAERLLAQSYESTQSVEAAKYLGFVRFETGDAVGAIEPLTRTAASFKDDVRCHYYLGMTLFSVGRNKESLAAFRKALDIEKDNPEILFLTANLYMLNGQPEEAVEL